MKNKIIKIIKNIGFIAVILVSLAIITLIILSKTPLAEKGNVITSANLYKEAIKYFYMYRWIDDPYYHMEELTYRIDAEFGYLKNDSNNVVYEIKTTGKIPTGGYIKIEKDIIKNGCIEFDTYKTEIIDNEVKDTKKGTC